MIDQATNSENELLRNVARGDEIAFASLMHKYANLLATYVFRLTKNYEQTEEIVQDTFLKIWQTRESLTDVQNFSAYIYVISRNRALNALRAMLREKKRMLSLQQELTTTYETPSDNSDEKYSLLEKAISQLPPQQREAWLLSRREGLKYAEIASRMNLSRETVKKYIQYASQSITRYFEDNIHLALYALLFIDF